MQPRTKEDALNRKKQNKLFMRRGKRLKRVTNKGVGLIANIGSKDKGWGGLNLKGKKPIYEGHPKEMGNH